jgi:RNA polymerase sigma-70 factor (ECF subfamily)
MELFLAVASSLAHGVAMRRLSPELRHKADDIAQDVCMALLTKTDRLTDFSEKGIGAYVVAMAHHKVVDVFRAGDGPNGYKSLQANIPEGIASALSPEDTAIRNAEAATLNPALSILSEKQRLTVWMRVAHGYSAEEVATLIGSTPGATRVQQYRSLRKLRKYFGVADKDSPDVEEPTHPHDNSVIMRYFQYASTLVPAATQQAAADYAEGRIRLEDAATAANIDPGTLELLARTVQAEASSLGAEYQRLSDFADNETLRNHLSSSDRRWHYAAWFCGLATAETTARYLDISTRVLYNHRLLIRRITTTDTR